MLSVCLVLTKISWRPVKNWWTLIRTWWRNGASTRSCWRVWSRWWYVRSCSELTKSATLPTGRRLTPGRCPPGMMRRRSESSSTGACFLHPASVGNQVWMRLRQTCYDNFVCKQMSSLPSTYHYRIRYLRRTRQTLDFNTASLIATSLLHSQLDSCNSIYYSLPHTQLHRL